MCAANDVPAYDLPDSDWQLSEYRVTLKDIEGPSWVKTFHALGEHDAKNQAREYAKDQGDDVRVIHVKRVEERAA